VHSGVRGHVQGIVGADQHRWLCRNDAADLDHATQYEIPRTRARRRKAARDQGVIEPLSHIAPFGYSENRSSTTYPTEITMRTMAAATLLAFSLVLSGCGDTNVTAPKRTPSAPGAKVFFVEPKDGAELTSPVTVKFGLEGMEVVPAGTEQHHSGHHHVLIDTTLDDPNVPIPADDNHVHFGKGQTEATLNLKPGRHTLQLVLGDHNHIPHDPIVQSEVITITVKE
jgi:hypothetical protein